MRWREPKDGDIRTRRVFLFFPVTACVRHTGKLETRWLEWATIQQSYKKDYYASILYNNSRWKTEYFLST